MPTTPARTMERVPMNGRARETLCTVTVHLDGVVITVS